MTAIDQQQSSKFMKHPAYHNDTERPQRCRHGAVGSFAVAQAEQSANRPAENRFHRQGWQVLRVATTGCG